MQHATQIGIMFSSRRVLLSKQRQRYNHSYSNIYHSDMKHIVRCLSNGHESLLFSKQRIKDRSLSIITTNYRYYVGSIPNSFSTTNTTGSSNYKRQRSIPNDGRTLNDFITIQQHDDIIETSTIIPVLIDNYSSTNNSQKEDNQYMYNNTVTTQNVLTDTNNANTIEMKFHIKTYGCQMNINDSDIVRSILLNHSTTTTTTTALTNNNTTINNTNNNNQQQLVFTEVYKEDDADIVLTNTCSIRDNAERKIWQRLHDLRSRHHNRITSNSYNTTTTTNNNFKRKKNDTTIIGVLGCMAERLQDNLLQDNLADLVVGPDSYRDLPRLINSIISNTSVTTNNRDNSSSSSTNVDDIVTTDTFTTDSIQEQTKEMSSNTYPSINNVTINSDKIKIDTYNNTAVNVQLSKDETYGDIFPTRSLLYDTTSTGSFHDTTTTNMTTTTQSSLAYVSIQRGCNNRCSFCIVPFTRGVERSRSMDSIIDEIRRLYDEDNIKEVTLLGQNVNSYYYSINNPILTTNDSSIDDTPKSLSSSSSSLYGLSNSGFRTRERHPRYNIDSSSTGYNFADLLDTVSNIGPNDLRVRFTSPHPKDYPIELLQLMSEKANICNSLHMPAQSGSTSVLQRMKRGYSREAYIELIDTVKHTINDVAISSDFITGFCNESNDEHDDTISLMEYVQYDQAYMFAYSLREQTYAARTMNDNVPEQIKQQRLRHVIDTFHTIVQQKNIQYEIGKLRLVLLDGPAKRQPVQVQEYDNDDTTQSKIVTWTGRTDQNKRILFTVNDDMMCYDDTNIHSLLRSLVASSKSSSGSSSIDEINRLTLALLSSSSLNNLLKVSIQQGDYGIVDVTEVKGHTLRGKLLWKTNITNFDNTNIATLDTIQHKAVASVLRNTLFNKKVSDEQQSKSNRQLSLNVPQSSALHDLSRHSSVLV